MELTLDLLKLQDGEQVKNTYYRSPRVSPTIQMISDDCLVVKTIDCSVEIRRIDEVILYILADFKFLPYWLIQQWTEDYLGSKSFGIEKVKKWIQVGLAWVDTAPTGVYIRPTRFLLDMFKDDVEYTNYITVPFTNLNHPLSEAQLMFDIQMGNPKSEMWNIIKEEPTLNCYHPLLTALNSNPPENENGTIILREALFRKGTKYRSNDEWLEAESLIRNQIMAGNQYTEEFNDFTLFNIVTYNQQENEKKDELYKQYPDLIVPLLRKDGRAQSYSIELELSAKDDGRYDAIMQSYKNNIKFGKLFYLCASQRISRMIKEAFQRAGGLGTCELYILPFTPPSMRLENFTAQDESDQLELFNTSMNITT